MMLYDCRSDGGKCLLKETKGIFCYKHLQEENINLIKENIKLHNQLEEHEKDAEILRCAKALVSEMESNRHWFMATEQEHDLDRAVRAREENNDT